MQGKNAPLQQLEGQVDALPNLLHTLLFRREILRKKNFDIKRVINVERINIKCAFAQCAAEAQALRAFPRAQARLCQAFAAKSLRRFQTA